MKSKPKIKESFEIINQNNNVLENDPNRIDWIKFLIDKKYIIKFPDRL